MWDDPSEISRGLTMARWCKVIQGDARCMNSAGFVETCLAGRSARKCFGRSWSRAGRGWECQSGGMAAAKPLSQLGKTWWLVWSLKTSLDSSTPRPCSQLTAAISWETRYHCTRKPRRQPELSRPERAVRRLGYILNLWAQYGAVDKSSTELF